MKDILYAFVKKHNIFDCTPNDDDEASNKEIDLEELMRIYPYQWYGRRDIQKSNFKQMTIWKQ